MALPPPKPAAGAASPYQVMLVDDSAVVRGFVTRILEKDPDVKIAASLGNGKLAITELGRRPNIDVIIIDIEMPEMDGLTAVPLLLKQRPGVQIVMLSSLTVRNAEVTMRALSAGAADYITKPSSSLSANAEFATEVLEKVKTLAERKRQKEAKKSGTAATPAPSLPSSAKGQAGEETPKKTSLLSIPMSQIKLVPENPALMPDVIAIGSSTGGPPALFKVFSQIRKDLKQPFMLTQHIPATFTKILADHLNKESGRPAHEGEDGMPVEDGHIYIAPGGLHMVVEIQSNRKVIRLLQTPPENFCRPAVDPMFRSIAKAYGSKVLGVVLTGMGVDGSKGAKDLVAAGGMVIAQDEASSIVWGMPGATAAAGVCTAVLPLDKVAEYINKIASRRIG